MARYRCSKRTDSRLMRNRSQRDDGLQIWKPGQHWRQELAAVVDFRADRLVFRWHASHSIDNAGIQQAQAVIGAGLEFAGRESEFAQWTIEKIPGIIAGKGASGSVGATQARCQSDNQEPDIAIMRRQKWRSR